MPPNLSTAGLARASARHPWRTIGVWLTLLVAAIVLIGTLLGDALTTDDRPSPTTRNRCRPTTCCSERLGEADTTIGEIVVVRSATLTVDDPAYRALRRAALRRPDGPGRRGGRRRDALLPDGRRVAGLGGPPHDPHPAGDPGRRDGGDRSGPRGRRRGQRGRLLPGPRHGSRPRWMRRSRRSPRTIWRPGEGIGISVALVVLALVFGAVAAAVLPIVLAIVAIVVALGATALVGQVVRPPLLRDQHDDHDGAGRRHRLLALHRLPLPGGAREGAGEGRRHRDRRRHRRPHRAAQRHDRGPGPGRTPDHAGFRQPDDRRRRAAGGRRRRAGLDDAAARPAEPDGRQGQRHPHPVHPAPRRPGEPAEADGGFWDWTTRAVMRRPVVSLVLAGGLLLAAASSIVDLNQGEVGISALPDGLMSKDAFIVLQEEFGFGQDLPAVVVIDGQTDLRLGAGGHRAAGSGHRRRPGLRHLGRWRCIRTPTSPSCAPGWRGTRRAQQAMDAVERLRADYIPTAFAGVPAKAMVTGKTAELVDLDRRQRHLHADRLRLRPGPQLPAPDRRVPLDRRPA